MNPWTIIGWFVLFVGAFMLAALAIGHILWWLAEYAMHVRTREDSPQPGDLWIDEPHHLRVKHVFPDGRVSLESEISYGSFCTFSHSAEEWRDRVLRRRMWRTIP